VARRTIVSSNPHQFRRATWKGQIILFEGLRGITRRGEPYGSHRSI